MPVLQYSTNSHQGKDILLIRLLLGNAMQTLSHFNVFSDGKTSQTFMFNNNHITLVNTILYEIVFYSICKYANEIPGINDKCGTYTSENNVEIRSPEF